MSGRTSNKDNNVKGDTVVKTTDIVEDVTVETKPSTAVVLDEINTAKEEVSCEPDATAVLAEINKSVKEVSGESNIEKKQPKTVKKVIDPSDKIPCTSLFFGKLTYTSPINGARYIWNDYGSIALIPSSELDTMSNFKPNYLQKPLILVNDADKVEELNLTYIYEQVANISKLEELFNSGDLEYIRKKIREAVAVSQRDTIISKVRKMRTENKLVDINIINVLKEELKFDIG